MSTSLDGNSILEKNSHTGVQVARIPLSSRHSLADIMESSSNAGPAAGRRSSGSPSSENGEVALFGTKRNVVAFLSTRRQEQIKELEELGRSRIVAVTAEQELHEAIQRVIQHRIQILMQRYIF